MVRWELWVIVWIAGRGLAGVALAVAALWCCRWEDQTREAFRRILWGRGQGRE